MAETTFSLYTPTAERGLQRDLNLTARPPEPKSLTEKYRPRTLAELVGQGCAVFRLETFLEAPYSTAFLFTGPTGVGKTTAALCLAAELGAVEFGGLDIIKSGAQDAEAVLAALDNLRFTPMLGSGWKVVIVDEADYMSPKAAQVWLSALEDLPPRSIIVFTTNKPDKFPDRFLDRCEHVPFESSGTTHMQDAQALVTEVWVQETGGDDTPRVEDLAGLIDADGQISYRRVLRALEPVLTARKATRQPTSSSPPDRTRPAGPTGTDPAALATRYRAGEELTAIAKSIGLSWNKVHVILSQQGVEFRPPKRSRPKSH